MITGWFFVAWVYIGWAADVPKIIGPFPTQSVCEEVQRNLTSHPIKTCYETQR